MRLRRRKSRGGVEVLSFFLLFVCVCVCFCWGEWFIRLRALGFGVSLTLNPMNLNPVGAQVNRFAGFGGWQGSLKMLACEDYG